MKSLNFLFLLVFLAFAAAGCSDDTITPGGPGSTVNVNGKVADLIGAGIPGVTVVIGSSTAVTSPDGSFAISGVTTPYTAKIVLAAGLNPVGLVYEGVTTANPVFYGTGLPSTPNTAKLTVSIPALLPNQQAQIIFADNGTLNYSNTLTGAELSDSIRIYWTGSTTITGKIVVLVYTFAAGQITTFDKYGEKLNYVLNNGGVVTEAFSNAELSTNPGENTVAGNVVPPAGYTTPKAHLMLKFSPSGSIAMGSRIGNELLASAYSFVVPTGLPSSFIIGVEGRSSGPIGEFNQKIITVSSGTTGNNINLLAGENLSTPPNNATGIDTNTSFTFTTASAGIILINFNSAGRSFIVITGSNSGSAKIPSFSAYGLALGSSVIYTWSVAKFPTIGSVDAFVSTAPYLNASFNEINQSESRSFTTIP
jgi:hypothetical protein